MASSQQRSPTSESESYSNFRKFLNNGSNSTSNGSSVRTAIGRSNCSYNQIPKASPKAENKSLSNMEREMQGFRDLIPSKDWSLTPNKRKENRQNASTLSEEWQKYRSPAPINFSDIVEENTIDGRSLTPTQIDGRGLTPNRYERSLPAVKHTFDPNEITGRSTTCKTKSLTKSDLSSYSPSVADILATSFVDDIREMCANLKNTTIDDNSIPRSSFVNVDSPKKLMENSRKFSLAQNTSLPGEQFIPSDQMKSQMIEDEKEWQNEFGVLPAGADEKSYKSSAEQSHRSDKQVPGKFVNLTEFSGILGDSTEESLTMSMGNYFLKRCEDIRDMIPNVSPPKDHPIALLGDSLNSGSNTNANTTESCKFSQASTSFYTDDELKIKSIPRVNNATYDKKEASVLSVSDIAARLSEDTFDSPKTFLSKLYKNKGKISNKEKEKSAILEPIGDILYITKPLPLPDDGPNSDKVQVLKMEQYYGKTPNWQKIVNAPNVTTITGASKQAQRIEPQLTEKILKNRSYEKQKEPMENVEKWISDKENIYNKNSSGDTLSFSESLLDLSESHISHSTKSSMKEELSPVRTKKVYMRKHSSPLEEAPVNSQGVTNKRMRSPMDQQTQKPQTLLSVPKVCLNGAETTKFSSNDFPGSPVSNKGHSSERNLDNTRNSPVRDSRNHPSDYSVRHVVRAVSNSPTGISIARSSSQCSSNSEFTQNDGKFPLKANKSELSWDCTKLRKSVSKSFVIKNTATKRLSLKIAVVGPGFQITDLEHDQHSIVLQGNECRRISVLFCPTVIGKAIGKIILKPTRNWPEERTVELFGYGGSTSLLLRGIERGPIGISFLKMADTDCIRSKTLERCFDIYNKGPLHGFAVITVKPKSNQHIQETHINISPNKCVIRPNGSVNITVTYKLHRKDLEKLAHKSCEVLTLATLEVIIGADPNRQRIATLLTRSESIPPVYKPLDFLIKGFPRGSGEDFQHFNESLENITDLFNSFRTNEIALTINKTTLDESRDNCSELSVDDSLFFRTLTPVNDTIKHYTNQPESANNYEKHVRRLSGESWSVWPKRLEMNQLENNKQTIVIRNNFYSEQTFQIDSNFRHLFSFSPPSGRIKPGSDYSVDVMIKQNIYVPSDVTLTVYIESDCIEIPVIVRTMHPPFGPK